MKYNQNVTFHVTNLFFCFLNVSTICFGLFFFFFFFKVKAAEMFPESFPFYKLERDLQAHINPSVFYIVVMGTE